MKNATYLVYCSRLVILLKRGAAIWHFFFLTLILKPTILSSLTISFAVVIPFPQSLLPLTTHLFLLISHAPHYPSPPLDLPCPTPPLPSPLTTSLFHKFTGCWLVRRPDRLPFRSLISRGNIAIFFNLQPLPNDSHMSAVISS